MTDCLRLPISFLPLLPKFFSVLLHSSDSDRNPNPGTWVSEAAVPTLPQGRNNFSPLPKLNDDHEPRSSRRLNHSGGKRECRDGNIDSVFYYNSPPSRTKSCYPISVGYNGSDNTRFPRASFASVFFGMTFSTDSL
jgi:hypothetical protein